ncbi:hypothetical protein R3P38DRAFT_3424495 [Favolaschia claudopus]|uniref:Uncharacterized protein n=1 Tax=Favolaschia claudopus TaxID=2862362 RepID=A0AAV9ZY76_9AGAR
MPVSRRGSGSIVLPSGVTMVPSSTTLLVSMFEHDVGHTREHSVIQARLLPTPHPPFVYHRRAAAPPSSTLLPPTSGAALNQHHVPPSIRPHGSESNAPPFVKPLPLASVLASTPRWRRNQRRRSEPSERHKRCRQRRFLHRRHVPLVLAPPPNIPKYTNLPGYYDRPNTSLLLSRPHPRLVNPIRFLTVTPADYRLYVTGKPQTHARRAATAFVSPRSLRVRLQRALDIFAVEYGGCAGYAHCVTPPSPLDLAAEPTNAVPRSPSSPHCNSANYIRDYIKPYYRPSNNSADEPNGANAPRRVPSSALSPPSLLRLEDGDDPARRAGSDKTESARPKQRVEPGVGAGLDNLDRVRAR